MKVGIVVSCVISIFTLWLALLLIRSYAPGLLGVTSDIQVVQTSKEVPPFFENVFNRSDRGRKEWIIPDPVLKRAPPQLKDMGTHGLHDILGFRNRSVPSVADIVVIGDSQTYGLNSHLDSNWPSVLQKGMRDKYSQPTTVYSMAVGGWGAIEYLEAFKKAVFFKPKIVVVAYYSGNDPLESFRSAYGNDHWAPLRPDDQLDSSDLPEVQFPEPQENRWEIEFSQKHKTIFTPTLRLSSNSEEAVAKAGYEIMARVAEEISSMAKNEGIAVYFTVIPTKETAYNELLKRENKLGNNVHQQLVSAELRNINWLSERISSRAKAQYIDVVSSMQQQLLIADDLYPKDFNGHPVDGGYLTIAHTILENLPNPAELPDEIFAIRYAPSVHMLAKVNGESYSVYESQLAAEQDGLKYK